MKFTLLLLPIIAASAAADALDRRAVCKRSLNRRGAGCTKPQRSQSPPPTRPRPASNTGPSRSSKPDNAGPPRNPKLDNTRLKMKATGSDSAIRMSHQVPTLSLRQKPGEPPRPPGPPMGYDPKLGFRKWEKSSPDSPKSVDITSRRPVAGQVYNGKGSIRGGNVRADVKGPSVVSIKDPSNDHGGSRLENVGHGESKVFRGTGGQNKEAKIKVQGTAQLHGHDMEDRRYLQSSRVNAPDTSALHTPAESLI